MKSFISPIYLKLNPATEEKLCVALIAVSESGIKFNFSEKKLKKAHTFIEADIYNSVKSSFKIMRDELALSEIEKDELKYNWNNVYTENYFNYLNKYSKGIIAFSDPKPVALNLDTANFNKLFAHFVGESLEIKKETVPSFKTRVNKIISRKSFQKIDTNFTCTPENIGNHILANHKIDFIGKNGVLFAGNSIDFNTSEKTIEEHLFLYNNIVVGLKEIERKNKLDKGTYNMFFNPPEAKEGKIILDKALKLSKDFEMKELGELENVSKVLEENNYMKFSEAGLIL